jgi:hypothetical protein
MRTAGNRVALLLAAVLASGSALLTAGAASAQQQATTATVNGAKIQKVGFRAMIQKETIMYNLAGFARNKPDVEAVAALMALIEGRTDDGKVVAMWAPGRTPQPGLAWAIRIKPNDVTFHEETDSPVYADRRNF